MTPAATTPAAIALRARRIRRAECDLPSAEERLSGNPDSMSERSERPGPGEEPTPTLFDDFCAATAHDLGGEPTLEALVSGVWEGLAAHTHAACPLCGGEMTAVYGVHARPVAGRCGDCGTTLD